MSSTREVTPLSLNVNAAVRERYSAAAQAAEAALCCPVDYDPQFLRAIPREILERDYGCGDPSKHLQAGETVLDLGSGGGKICYIAAQVVGAQGKVIGIDCNDEMLDLARKYQPEVSTRLGYDNVEFRKGRIQDLKLDLELLELRLRERPVTTSADWLHAQEFADELRATKPLVDVDSIDVVVSNCVLNLVSLHDRQQLFQEIYRVLKRGGRAVISDIVSDEDVPAHLQQNAQLWSGCLSGAFREDLFMKAFEEAGFYGIQLLSRQAKPWAVIDGIEFRSVTVQAFKGKDGPCLDHHEAVIYQGPWKAVIDDDGHQLVRGQRTAVCRKTLEIYSKAPYDGVIIPLPPVTLVRVEDARPFDCHGSPIRSPQVTKSGRQLLNLLPSENCCDDSGCC